MIKIGLNPDDKARRALVLGLCGGGKVDLAYELIVDMMKCGAPTSILVIMPLLVGFVSCDQLMLMEAEKLMEKNGHEPDIYSYNQFLKGLCKAKRLDKAYLLLDVMEVKGLCDIVSYNTVIEGLCSGQHTKKSYTGLCKVSRMNEAMSSYHNIKGRTLS
uniref:Pentatricopeptide repeat-containing protein n=1 Tax=Chenopodium quinoa TaxID=63459 RepID=A0A803LPR5_CHEQI